MPATATALRSAPRTAETQHAIDLIAARCRLDPELDEALCALIDHLVDPLLRMTLLAETAFEALDRM
jgi:hypothetical protein